jgi:hypothetical protein
MVSGLGHQKDWPLSLRVLFEPSMLQEFDAVLEARKSFSYPSAAFPGFKFGRN